MIHPDTRVAHVGVEVGVGVVATRYIPRGTITWVRDALDRRLEGPWVAALPKAYAPLIDRYTFADGKGGHILCWDHARLMNHACEATCLGTDFGFEVAAREIAPGEQLTCDYATLHLRPDEALDCRCGSAACRGRITPELTAQAARQLEMALRDALALAPGVAQPLAGLLDPARLEPACRALGIPPFELGAAHDR